jgi:hypothetical protein
LSRTRPSLRNLELVRLRLRVRARVFEGDTSERGDTRWTMGARVVAVGRVDGLTLVVVYPPRSRAADHLPSGEQDGATWLTKRWRRVTLLLPPPVWTGNGYRRRPTRVQQIASDAGTAPDLAGAPAWRIVRRLPVPDASAIFGPVRPVADGVYALGRALARSRNGNRAFSSDQPARYCSGH